MTTRLAAYQPGQVCAVAASVALAPSRWAVMDHSESPRRTTTICGWRTCRAACSCAAGLVAISVAAGRSRLIGTHDAAQESARAVDGTATTSEQVRPSALRTAVGVIAAAIRR